MFTTAAILIATAAAALALIWPPLARATLWRAMLTPLASIIGSGFLVLGPLLLHSYGSFAPLVMAGLCALAYAYGWAVRRNIMQVEDHETGPIIGAIEHLSSWALAFAYVVSVAYYLNLFGAFAVSLTPFDSAMNARLVTSAALIFVGLLGLTRGFAGLERGEQIAVGIKLAIIAGLLAGFLAFFMERASGGALTRSPIEVTGWPAFTLAAGLLVTVQGFETSRYLGQSYSPETRVRSMKAAQWLAALIYMAYTLLIAFTFTPSDMGTSETAIIELTRQVATILPPLLVLAALAAQLSAAIADTGGSGGLIHELSRGRLPEKPAYLLLVLIGLAITWSFDVFTIIAHASRAFAAYYGLQAAIAALNARQHKAPVTTQAALWGLAVLAIVIVVFGEPAEG